MHYTSPQMEPVAKDNGRSDNGPSQQDKLATLGHMASSIAHDLNNPLTSIQTSVASILAFWPANAEAIPSAQHGPASLREDLELMAEEAQRARRIIAGLLEFASHREPRSEPVSLGKVARATLRLARHHLEQHNISLVCESPRDIDDHAMGDFHRLQQVAMNLVINSQQAATDDGDRGTIWIRVLPAHEGLVHMLVEDDGPGVPPDLHLSIFNPYYTTKTKGTGLGLSIAKQIVTECCGTLTIEDRPEGGARFRVALPSIPGPMTMATNRPERPPALAAARTHYRILLVDDEPGILKSTSRFLRRFGWTVDLAEDGHAALARMEGCTYDAVLSDLRMPGLNGEELYAEVLRSHPELATRIAFASGDTMRGETESFLNQCGCPTLQKPYDLPDLIDVLEQCANGSVPTPTATVRV